jgi:protein lysine acetyltransferase
MSPSPLTELPLFADCRAEEVASLASRMAVRQLAAGDRLMVQGEDSRFFAVVVSGELRITRNEGDGARELALAGPGAILGEIGLLARRSRLGTVTATTDAEVLTGDAEVFEHLLGLPGVTDRVWRLASIRLAEDVRPVPVSLPDGTPVLLRPLLPSDRATLADAVRRVSAETLRRRFLAMISFMISVVPP